VTKRKTVLVPLAFGFEEIEAVTVVDVLRRAGLNVLVAGVGEPVVSGSRRLKLVPDVPIERTAEESFDAVVLPGGMPGTQSLARSSTVTDHVHRTFNGGGWIGAICAAPTILVQLGLLHGRRATSHPSVRDSMQGAVYEERDVVVAPPIVTSRGPGTAMAFALKMVELLTDEARARDLAKALVAG
jgi:4-methyl-5(b-hydroxyethyl)-thiazole monophosphate biosynthesis